MIELDQRYRLLQPIGRGGVGEVFEGLQLALDRRVAIKLLRPELTARPEVVSRFEQEARTTCRLQHPNVVTVYDVGTAPNGGRFLVMELLDGLTLAEALERGPFSLERSLDVAGQIARGMGAGQGVGLVHRDLKPENIHLVGEDHAHVKILDFGLARLRDGALAEPGAEVERSLRNSLEQARRSGSSSLETMAPGGAGTWVPEDPPRPPLATVPPIGGEADPRLTRPGALVGTPRYMAPEQALAWAVDHRADIYAFGCILYEMVTGRAPFEEASIEDYLRAHVHGVVRPPSELAPVQKEVEELILHCLHKDPAARWPDWAAVQEELRLIRGVSAPRGQLAEPRELKRPTEPFRFLLPFQASSAVVFYGRDADTQRFLSTWEHPDQPPLVALTGASGVGKTSFLHARLLPALEDTGHELLVVQGSERPTEALRDAARRTLARLSGEVEDRPLAELLDQLSARAGRPVAVVLDQLEELFTAGTEADHQRFQADVAALLGGGDGGVRLLLSLREDYLGQLLRTLHPLPVDQLLRTLPLRPLQPADLVEALEGPGRPGLPVDYPPFTFQRGLAEEIVADLLADDAGEVAPRVQAVGHLLWQMVASGGQPHIITREHYTERLGGAHGILGRLLDEAIAGLDQADRGLAKELLRALTHLPGSATSRPSGESSLIGEHSDPERAREVLRRLESRYRLIQGFSDPRWPGERAYRVAHEALIARIQAYGEELSERNRARQIFRQGLDLWLRNGRQSVDLLVEEHFEVVQRNVGELVFRTPDQRTFYRQSHDRNYEAWVAREITEKKQARKARFLRMGLPVLTLLVGWGAGELRTGFSAFGANYARVHDALDTHEADLRGLSMRYARLGGLQLLAPDLRDADLTSADLTGAQLESAQLQGAILEGAALDKAVLVGADLTGARLLRASFPQADLRKATVDTDRVGADFTGAIFDASTDWGQEPPPKGAVGPGSEAAMAVLSMMAFEDLDLEDIDLQEAELQWASFRGSYMVGANLQDVQAEHVDLSRTKLGNARLTGATLTGASLADADLANAVLTGADLSGASLVGARLGGAELSSANLAGAVADGRTLWPAGVQPQALGAVLLVPGVDLSGVDLSGRDLRGATLRGLDLSGQALRGADLEMATLTGADLREADLRDADLRGANLDGADLRGAKLEGADMTAASTTGALMDQRY